MLRLLFSAIAVATIAAGSVSAQQASPSAPVEVKDVWSRATAGGSKTGAAYATLTNKGTAGDRLVSASTPVAGKVELHTMSMEGDVMRMRQIDGIDVNPGASVELKPGGLHIMLMDLKAPLKEGDKFPLTLNFEKGGSSTLDVSVRSLAATGGKPAEEQNMQHMHK